MTALPIYVASKINFVVSARDLPNKNRGSTGLSSVPDPYVKVWHKDNTQKDWVKLAETKHVINSTNPDWFEVFSFDWKRETGQVWRVDVNDFDPLNKDDLIGAIEVDVDRYVLEHHKQFIGKLQNGGSIHIQGTSVLQFLLQVENLPKLDTGSGSDAYVECFWSFGPHGERHLFHKTKTVGDAQNVAWKDPVSFNSYQRGANQYITFKVFDEDTIKDEVIGEVSFALDEYVDRGDVARHRLNEAKNKATITITPAN